MTDFSPGDRVTWNEAENPHSCENAMLAGEYIDHGHGIAMVRRDDGHSFVEDGLWRVQTSILKPERWERPSALCQCGQTAWRGELDFDGSPLCGDCSSMVADLCGVQGDVPRGEELRAAHARHFRAERQAKKLAQAKAQLDSHPKSWPADSWEDVGETGVGILGERVKP